MRIGLIGCGAIGSYLVKRLIKGQGGHKLAAVFDTDPLRIQALRRQVSPEKLRILSPEEMVKIVDVMVECASVRAVSELIPIVMNRRIKLIVISSGGLILIDKSLLRKLRSSKCELYVPSGAMGGFDLLSAVSETQDSGKRSRSRGELSTGSPRLSLTLTTRKPPHTLGFKNLKRAKLVFEGGPREAVRRYPRNVNIAATALLALGYPDRVSENVVRVKIVADPKVRRNEHILTLSSESAIGEVHVVNRPLKDNPRTSVLAALSILSLLRRLESRLVIG